MKTPWQQLQEKLKERFGSEMEYDAILFTIGLQELGKDLGKKFKKDEKLEVMHIAICTLLEPYGFYEYVGRDEQGWPHWKLIKELPHFDLLEQEKLLKIQVMEYFEKEYQIEI